MRSLSCVCPSALRARRFLDVMTCVRAVSGTRNDACGVCSGDDLCARSEWDEE